MSPAFLSGIEAAFPNARVTLDKFHLVAMLTKAVDETRKESGRYRALRGTRWLWQKNPSNLSDAQKAALQDFLESNDFSKTARAYSFKLQFQGMFQHGKNAAQRIFDAWLDMTLESGLKHVEKVASTFFSQYPNIRHTIDL